MNRFVKVYDKILTSSIWEEPAATRVVWLALLAKASSSGLCEVSEASVARLANVTPEAASRALQTLLEPDPHSKSKAYEGRRIEIVEGGIQILNYERYREWQKTGDSSSAGARRQREYRERLKKKMTGKTSRDVSSSSSSNNKKKSAKRNAKWTIVPDSWQPTEAHAKKAKELGVDMAAEVEKFRLWEFKEPKTDADRAFHRWLRGADKVPSKPSGGLTL